MSDEVRSKLPYLRPVGHDGAKGDIGGHALLANNTKPLIITLAAHLLLVYDDRLGL